MPMMDNFGVIRVGGRLQHSNLDYNARHPIILPKGHSFTASMVMHFHRKLLHAGSQCLLASIRPQYWPVGGRKLICSIISSYIRCFKVKPKLEQHIMGSLPESGRITPNQGLGGGRGRVSPPHHGPPTSLRKAYRANWPVDQRFLRLNACSIRVWRS